MCRAWPIETLKGLKRRKKKKWSLEGTGGEKRQGTVLAMSEQCSIKKLFKKLGSGEKG